MRKERVYKYEVGKWWLMLERFIEWLRVHNYSATTIEGRYKNIRLFIAWCEERALLDPTEISFSQLERYQIWSSNYRKANSKYLGVATQIQRMVSVRVFFQYLLKHKHIEVDQSAQIELPRLAKKLPSAILNIQLVEKVLQQASLSTKKGIRDRAIMEVLYSTGIRRAEVANLSISSLDKERGMLFITQGKGAKDRCVPIGERAIAFCELYIEKVRPQLAKLSKGEDERMLFLNQYGLPFSLGGLSNNLKEYIKKAGIEQVGSCHIFRHTCATVMLEAGADIRYIQEMLGHNSLATTQIYTRVFDQKLKEVHSRTHPSSKLLKPIEALLPIETKEEESSQEI